jgi:hypothetical protein
LGTRPFSLQRASNPQKGKVDVGDFLREFHPLLSVSPTKMLC